MTGEGSRAGDQAVERSSRRPSIVAGNGWLFGLILVAFLGFMAVYEPLEQSSNIGKFGRAEFELWADLAGVMVGFALAAFLVMSSWLRGDLARFKDRPATAKHLLRWAGELLLVFVLLGIATHWYSSANFAPETAKLNQTEVQWFGRLTFVLAMPGLLGMLMLRRFAAKDENWSVPTSVSDAFGVANLRKQLGRYLATLGLLLTIIVVQAGARRHAVLTVHGAKFPGDFVVLLGLLFAALLALLHGAATWEVNSRAERIIEDLAPIPDPLGADLGSQVQHRQNLQQIMGGAAPWQSLFQSGVIVLAPLITAFIGSALAK